MAWFDRSPGGKTGPETEPEKAIEEAKPTPQPVSETPAPPPKVEVPPKTSEAGVVGQLYKGSRVSGQVVFEGSAWIDGSVEGEVHCHETLTIGEGAEVRAKISGKVIVIRGKVEGNVTAKEKLELAAPARLFGNVVTSRLVISEGVVFDGDCSMGVAKEKEKVGVASSKSINADKVSTSQASKRQVDSEK
jgi:cytoskeletal protein CcmA (bactofilin family)